MDFKYLADYKRLTSLTEDPETCEICDKETICFDTSFFGEEEVEYICPKCIFTKQLYDRDIFTNNGDHEALVTQIKELNPGWSAEQVTAIADEKTKELEQATPALITWQDMDWPCIDGDYGKFIGYGSKKWLNTLAPDGNGKELFIRSLHPQLAEYYEEAQWKESVPDKMIANYEESTEHSPLFYVFKSLSSDKLVIWWDCD